MTIAHLVIGAISVNEKALALTLLRIGDGLFSGRLEAAWKEASHNSRLTLAATSGDTETFERLSQGGSSHFYRGLLALQVKDYAAAAVAFEQAVATNPSSAPAHVNLFSARLDIAESERDSTKQRELAQAALDAWTFAEAGFSVETRNRLSEASTLGAALSQHGSTEQSRSLDEPKVRAGWRQRVGNDAVGIE